MPSPMKENHYILISLIAKLETSSSILFLSILSRGEKTIFDLKHAIQITSLKKLLNRTEILTN